MNLMKLFNMKYFMQNVKKSKMAILLFLSIVPIFTALTIITLGKDSILEFWKLGLANIIFMYITPFVLSVVLFGYVYKKKSIDFIGSMPISRKSIFITNTIGGSVLLILSQLVTLLVSLLAGTLVGGTVFVGMLWDIFVYQSIAYIFVFTISNLAMSLSGNILTQIVTTLLITFLIPSGVAYFDIWNSVNSYRIADEYGMLYSTVTNTRNYTAPSAVFGCAINGMSYEYNNTSIAKMVVLSLIYIVIGYIMFNKKIMESAGESFQNKYEHLVVKGLTLIPFAMILVPLVEEREGEAILFIIAIIAVYYLIYDLITNKKNKLITNLVAMIVSILVLFSVYDVIAKAAEDTSFTLEIEDVKSVVVKNAGYNIKGLDIEVTDSDLIQKILVSDRRYSGSRTYMDTEINLKNGTKKLYDAYVGEDVLEVILKQAKTEDFEVKKIECNFNFFNATDKKVNKNLKIALNNALKANGINEIYRKDNASGVYIYAYDYVNHGIRRIAYPMNISKDVFNIVTKMCNQSTVDYIKNREYSYIYISIGNDVGYYGDCPTELRKFIIENRDTVCNMDEEYMYISIGVSRFYTNDIQTVKDIIKKNDDKLYKEEKFLDHSFDDIEI